MTITDADVLEKMRPLTQDERLQARQKARAHVVAVIGTRPSRDEFSERSVSRYPHYVMYSIIGLCLIALMAAFTPSAIRLYHIGSETFLQSIDHQPSARIVGLSIVLMAELSQVVFSLSLAILGTSRTSRYLLYFGMFIATLIALVGNAQVALPDHWQNPFAWLEALAPPLIVLSLSYILKEQMLQTIETRHTNEVAFQEVLREYEALAGKPEEHPAWMRYYANSIRDELMKANRRKKSLDINAIPVTGWRVLVSREMQAEDWFSSGVVVAAEPQKGGEVRERINPFGRSNPSNGANPD